MIPTFRATNAVRSSANGGAAVTTTYACEACGAALWEQDIDLHIEWHRNLPKKRAPRVPG